MKASYPYPIETLKHWYITPLGGQSKDLKPGQVGLNGEALAGNTDLVPYQDRVSISKLDGGGSVPLFAKKYFEVVPLDKSSPDALSRSPNGEAVFPCGGSAGLKDDSTVRFLVGEIIVLNGVISQRFPREYASSIRRSAF